MDEDDDIGFYETRQGDDDDPMIPVVPGEFTEEFTEEFT